MVPSNRSEGIARLELEAHRFEMSSRPRDLRNHGKQSKDYGNVSLEVEKTMDAERDTIIHLVAGGVAGTVGAIVTCPLEVVKTRLQSSSCGFHVQKVCLPKIATTSSHVTCKTIPPLQRRRLTTVTARSPTQILAISHSAVGSGTPTMGLVQCLRHIVEHEGPRALFKGLGPNLVGVAPSRAIYFCAYSQSKSFLNSVLTPDTAIVHVCSASCAVYISLFLLVIGGKLVAKCIKTTTSPPGSPNKKLHCPYWDCMGVVIAIEAVAFGYKHRKVESGKYTTYPVSLYLRIGLRKTIRIEEKTTQLSIAAPRDKLATFIKVRTAPTRVRHTPKAF
uniref:Mitochondrial carrier protein n=1 Tax=Timema cristinae TaxID=61476 RepID=A0A7R9D3P3_TIMCR|nr:unnamed protein product [Timema cristinae]